MPAPSSRTNKAALAVGLIIFIAVIYLLGPSEIAFRLATARPTYLVCTIFAFAFGCAVRIYKWSLMRTRTGADIVLNDLAGLFFASKFWGSVSPMRSGEAAPVFLSGTDRGKLLSLILYDRVVESLQTIIVSAVLFFVYYGVFFGAPTGFALAGILAVLIVVVFLMLKREAGEFLFDGVDRALTVFGGFGPARTLKRIIGSVRAEMEQFYDASASFFSMGFGLGLLALTFVSWGGDLIFWALIFKSLSVDAPLIVVAVSVVVFQMSGALAPVPGGLGISDVSLALLLGYFGYAGDAGGIIILIRALSTAYIFAAYLLFSRSK